MWLVLPASRLVTAAVKTVAPDATIQANTKTKLVNVKTQASQTVIKKAIAVAGYPTT
jgi:copper chaperone